uniref:WSC domain-containing protein n=1 Tax=Corethron hystrix TaxID=216773 RepID=A0A6U5KNV4_9STRA|mmetsp:Transcript_40919/g.96010  ORF Transcript_40919/g.96010 Transcript_40919/m.96010 type:complete len:350 (+) Transcript_40919:81-1130(+)
MFCRLAFLSLAVIPNSESNTFVVGAKNEFTWEDSKNGLVYRGCYKDSVTDRALPVRMQKSGASVQTCATLCEGYDFFGRQWKGQCWCGNDNFSKHGKSKSCNCDGRNVGKRRNCVFQRHEPSKSAPFLTSNAVSPSTRTFTYRSSPKKTEILQPVVTAYPTPSTVTTPTAPSSCMDNEKFQDAIVFFKFDRLAAEKEHGPIDSWRTCEVTVMNNSFRYASAFNENLNAWDTSLVESLSMTFSHAVHFNGDISQWDVSSVRTYDSTFSNAVSFNRDISQWDVSSATDMYSLFYKAGSFNFDLTSWEIAGVTDMNFMFWGASSFDQSLCWNVARRETLLMFHLSKGGIECG